MAEERDPVLERVVRELSPLPPADPDAVARIVAMAVGRGAEPRVLAPRVDEARARRFSLAAVGSLAAAAAIVGFVLRGFVPSSSAPVSAVARAATADTPTRQAVPDAGVARLAARASDAETVRPVQFVLHSPGARRVSLIGDFNGWDVGRSPMRDATASGVWTVTVPVRPGRHVYAFLVDGTEWTLDPRAPRTTDPDFGVKGSVMIVGVP